jgi:hypothetical protein
VTASLRPKRIWNGGALGILGSLVAILAIAGVVLYATRSGNDTTNAARVPSGTANSPLHLGQETTRQGVAVGVTHVRLLTCPVNIGADNVLIAITVSVTNHGPDVVDYYGTGWNLYDLDGNKYRGDLSPGCGASGLAHASLVKGAHLEHDITYLLPRALLGQLDQPQLVNETDNIWIDVGPLPTT